MGIPAIEKPEMNAKEGKELISVALDSMTDEMVVELARKAVSAIELLDDILQPETISLLRKLPETGKSLENTLDMLQTLEQTDTLKTLIELGEMASSLKASITNTMVTDLTEKAISGIELADDLLQQGGLEMVQGMTNAFAKAEQNMKSTDQAPSLRQIVHSLKDPEVRKGLGLMIAFLKLLPSELDKTTKQGS
ncbi:DUF1641 domain-containing protein [Thermoactinomyces mirandus]|uniref:DUF1641 domain-containing protein n=1 Tax=Thermoactinomyces mirandus TaxID=2756294 RepID=A0A7W1XUM0_9BACL|nr:DUF1641 domain-containing protein [Thermoactinomyces mirandus]MBA4603362.1 DUF1641 domain-containing protein [Thermoactinomyces mirandus]